MAAFTLLVVLVLLAAASIAVYCFPGRVLALLIVAARPLCGFTSRKVLIDGYSWSYLDSGGENKPVMLLIHGFGADKDSWLPYARLLRNRFRVIAPDLPGFGESLRDPSLDYSVNAQSERLRRFIGKLGLDKVHLAGNSLGGFISGWYALKFPGSLHSLAFIDSAGVEGSSKSEADLVIEAGSNPFAVKDFQDFEKTLALVAYKPPKIPRFIKRALYAELQKRQAFLDVLFWKLLADLKGSNLREHLQRLDVPTLILWGRQDRLVNVSSAIAMHERIRNSVLVILEEVGHAPMFEAPRKTAEHHLQFIDGLGCRVPQSV